MSTELSCLCRRLKACTVTNGHHHYMLLLGTFHGFSSRLACPRTHKFLLVVAQDYLCGVFRITSGKRQGDVVEHPTPVSLVLFDVQVPIPSRFIRHSQTFGRETIVIESCGH